MKHRIALPLVVSFALFLAACSIDSVPNAERIACIGTSITDGYALSVDKTYPSQLQVLESSTNNKVLNYGVGGCAVLRKSDSPYWNAQKYQYALSWKPSIVIIEFGTNDSKKQNWQYKNEFKSDYVDLIKSFQALSSSPKIYICIPPPAFSTNFEIDSAVVRKEIVPLLQTIAKENNLPVIDLYTLMQGKSNLFVDGIHPTAEGASLIASEVYKVITTK